MYYDSVGTPGITAIVGGRPKPSPCLKLYSFLYPKHKLDATITIDGETETYRAESLGQSDDKPELNITQPDNLPRGDHSYRLEELAYTRSGDKVKYF